MKYFAFLFFLLNCSAIEAQQQFATNREAVFLHTNATGFVSAETLYYKLYCLGNDNSPSRISKVGYVELVAADKSVIFRHKLFLENGMASGDFFIPASVPTGNYKLIGYTRWMLNKEELETLDIFIANPFEAQAGNKPSAKTENTLPAASKVSPSSDAYFTLMLPKKTYSSREKIDLQIKPTVGKIEKGNYSISVRKMEDLPAKAAPSATAFSKTTAVSATGELSGNLILPELRGEIISGSIVSKSNASVVGKAVALSIVEKSFQFKSVKTDSQGKFTIVIDKIYATENVYLQLIDADRNDFSIVLDKPAGIDYSKLVFPSDFYLPETLKATLEARAIASQVENAFLSKKRDSLLARTNRPVFFDPLAKSYALDNYTRFKTLKETTTEVVTEMYLTSKNNTYSLNIRDNNPLVEVEKPAMVLVDGLLLQDINELMEYRMENVDKISIVQGGYYYGTELYNGLISFTTKNSDFVSKVPGNLIVRQDIGAPLFKKSYFMADYADSTKNTRIPDFRYQLLWIPELNLDGGNTVSFYTSDISGTFEITVEGFTESGKPVSLQETFDVQ